MALYWNRTLPSVGFFLAPADVFADWFPDSAWAKLPYNAIINSLVMVSVFIIFFFKDHSMPRSFSCLTYSRQSTVFPRRISIWICNYEIDLLVFNILIMVWIQYDFFVWVPDIRFVTKEMPTSDHSFFLLDCGSVYDAIWTWQLFCCPSCSGRYSAIGCHSQFCWYLFAVDFRLGCTRITVHIWPYAYFHL